MGFAGKNQNFVLNGIPMGNFVNHGQKAMKLSSSLILNEGQIIITVGDESSVGGIANFTIQINEKNGPQIQTWENVKTGQAKKIETDHRIVVCTLVDYPENKHVLIHVTEHIK